MRVRSLGVPAAVSARRIFADGGGLFVAVGFYLIVTTVLAHLWGAAADAGGGSVAGYSGVALAWYVATSEAAICSMNIRLIELIGDDIASGAVASELLRPASVLAVRLASETGRALARLSVLVVPGGALAWVVAGPPPRLLGVALAVPSLVLAVACNLALQHAVAGMSFWIRDARGGWFLYQKFIFILGGMLIPLEVLPDALGHAAMWLPFMAMAYAPARLASGHVEPALLLVQLAWLGVLGVVAAGVFSSGERRLQVVGG